MISLISLLVLAQCTKDIDCKGERLCNAGQCIESIGAPATQQAYAPQREAPSNPFRVHRLVAMSISIGLWVASSLTALAVGDELWPTTIIPVIGPLITYLRVVTTPWWYQFQGAWVPPLLIMSTVLQLGSLAYLIAAIIREQSYEWPVAVVPGPGGLAFALRF